MANPNEMPRQNWDSEEFIEDPSRQRNEALKNSRSQQEDLRNSVEKTQPAAPATKPTAQPEEATRNPDLEITKNPEDAFIQKLTQKDFLTRADFDALTQLHKEMQKKSPLREREKQVSIHEYDPHRDWNAIDWEIYNAFAQKVEASLGKGSPWHQANPDSPYIEKSMVNYFKFVTPKGRNAAKAKTRIVSPEKEIKVVAFNEPFLRQRVMDFTKKQPTRFSEADIRKEFAKLPMEKQKEFATELGLDTGVVDSTKTRKLVWKAGEGIVKENLTPPSAPREETHTPPSDLENKRMVMKKIRERFIQNLTNKDHLTEVDLQNIKELHNTQQDEDPIISTTFFPRNPHENHPMGTKLQDSSTSRYNAKLYKDFSTELEAALGKGSPWQQNHPMSPYIEGNKFFGGFSLVKPKGIKKTPAPSAAPTPGAEKVAVPPAPSMPNTAQSRAELPTVIDRQGSENIYNVDIFDIYAVSLNGESQKQVPSTHGFQRLSLSKDKMKELGGTAIFTLTNAGHGKTNSYPATSFLAIKYDAAKNHSDTLITSSKKDAEAFVKLTAPKAAPSVTPRTTPEKPVATREETQKLSTDNLLDALVHELCGKEVLTKADVKKINDLYFKYKTEHGAYARGSKFPPNLAVAEKFRNDIEQAVGEANRPGKNYITYGKGGVFSRDFQLVERKNK